MTNTTFSYLYSILRNKWYNFVYCYSPIYIRLNLLKCFSDWWRARKDYKFPHLSLYFGDALITPGWHNQNTKLLYISSHSAGYKYKWNYLSWEKEPYFVICLFNKFKFTIMLDSPCTDIRGYRNNHEYWESMMYYLHMYDKDIRKTFENWGWESSIIHKGEKGTYKIIVCMNTWDWNFVKNNDLHKRFYKDYKYITIKEDEDDDSSNG